MISKRSCIYISRKAYFRVTGLEFIFEWSSRQSKINFQHLSRLTFFPTGMSATDLGGADPEPNLFVCKTISLLFFWICLVWFFRFSLESNFCCFTPNRRVLISSTLPPFLASLLVANLVLWALFWCLNFPLLCIFSCFQKNKLSIAFYQSTIFWHARWICLPVFAASFAALFKLRSFDILQID